MSMWKPIESAPKDGNGFLVYDGNTIGIVYWEFDYESIVCSYSFAPLSTQFTHWMPLPEPPTDATP